MSIGSRCARAAAAGGGLGALWALIVSAPDWDGSSACSPLQFCVGYAVLVMPVLLVAGAIVAWPLLHAVGVRPAALPALLGPLVALVLYFVIANITFPSSAGDTPFLILSSIAVVISYVVAAFLTAPGLPTPWRVSAIVVAVAGVLVLRMVVP
jgi:hypothetical protein